MKKFTYLATALLVLAGAAGCKKNADVQEPEVQPSGKLIPFSVAAGQGTSKTSMSGKTLVWDSGDAISVMTTKGAFSTNLTLFDGAGSNEGKFSGQIDDALPDGSALVGLYQATFASEGNYTVSVPAEQTFDSLTFQKGKYPSIGTGTYDKGGTTTISFQNPMGVLRLKLRGSATVTKVKITAATYNIAGDFNVTSSMAVSDGSNNSKSITIDCSENPVTLETKGVYFNFVTAPFGDQVVVVEVTNNNGDSTSENIQVSVSGSSASKKDVDVCIKPKESYGEAEITGGTMVKWVQLWAGGPKFAEYNVGSDTNHNYNAYYTWGGSYKNGSGFNWDGSYNSDYADLAWNADPTKATDTATKLWGANWRMPTKTELEALINTSNTTSSWVTNYNGTGKNGRLYTGKGDYACNSVFFPAAGSCKKGTVSGTGSFGTFWSSTHLSNNDGYLLDIYSDNRQLVYNFLRPNGYSVRAVLK